MGADVTDNTETLYLKWGTLKGWDVNPDGPAMAALRRYHEQGVAGGAMMQKDTPEQVEIICEVIDAIDGKIVNDWSGERMSKDEAKAYVREYDRSWQ